VLIPQFAAAATGLKGATTKADRKCLSDGDRESALLVLLLQSIEAIIVDANKRTDKTKARPSFSK